MPTISKRKSSQIDITKLSLSPDDVSGEYVITRFVPLRVVERSLGAMLWGRNAKKHDIGGVYESICAYGFVDYPKWENALNGGAGGIAIGNGRTKTIVQALIEARDQGKEPPRGIPVSKADGDWCIPIGFGVDQPSEAKAEALGIDHNNLTLSGADMSHWDMAKIWDREGYLQLLTSIADAEVLPVTVDEDTIAALLAGVDDTAGQALDGDESSTQEINPDDFDLQCRCPKCGFEFDAKK